MAITRDPKGYYIALGLTEDADMEAIKSAYRSKAKRLHPDFNPSPVAAKQFHRLHEAYSTLNDAAKREIYDRPWKTDRAKTKSQTEAPPQPDPRPQPKAEPKAEAPRAEKQQAEKQQAEKPHARADSSIEQPAVCKCGKVTAQPRYIVFDLVWGRLKTVQRRGIAGIFCRSCADRTAVRASLITWLAGWWAWPEGPRATVRALLNNMRGGRKPADRNARLLMRQARAFRGRGEMELARNAAEQALTFATTAVLRREVDHLLSSLSGHPARPLKNRWSDPGWAPTVQILPLALIIAALSMSVTMSGLSPFRTAKNAAVAAVRWLEKPMAPRTSESPGPPSPPSQTSKAAVGRVFSVTADNTAVRTGPGATYQMVAALALGSVVLVTETDPSGAWLRITTPDGAAGFVPASALSPDVSVDALKDVGSFAKPPAP